MAEPIEMPFGISTQVGPRNHVLDGVQIALCEGTIFKGRPWHAQQHSVVSSAKMAEPIEILFGLWTLVGPKNRVLDRVRIAPCQGQFFGEKDMPRHA